MSWGRRERIKHAFCSLKWQQQFVGSVTIALSYCRSHSSQHLYRYLNHVPVELDM